MASTRLRRDAVQYYNSEDGLRLIADGNYGFIALRCMDRMRDGPGGAQRYYVLSGAQTREGRFPHKPEWVAVVADIPTAVWAAKSKSWRIGLRPAYGRGRDQRAYVDHLNQLLAPILTEAIMSFRLNRQTRRRRYHDARAAALVAADAPPVTDA